MKPGKRHAFAHRHRRAEEIYVVISGSGRVKLLEKLLADLGRCKRSPTEDGDRFPGG